jgi:acetoacetyl-CoA reductase
MEQMKNEGFSIELFYGDVSNFESAGKMITDIEAKYGHIDTLVNNAGITRDGRLVNMSVDDWHAVINTNLNSVFNCTKHVIQGMIDRKFGRIINISSVNGQRGQFGQTNYSAAKAGIIGFSKALALENANKGITVNVIAPGYVGTDMVKKIDPTILKGIVSQIPTGRLAEPAEIAALASYLVSDKAGFITGATFSINGGQYMQ